MSRSRKGHSRPVSQRREILVFTEGEKTEGGYLLPWRRAFRDRVLVSVDPFHGPPASLVDTAVQVKREQARDAKRGKGRGYDEIWCMFDIDAHPNVPEAVQKAQANGVRLAISNPCLELWFMLHFEERTSYIGRHDAQTRAADLLSCGKNLSAAAMNALFEQYEDARRRARRLDKKHFGDGSPAGSNPSSSVWTLVDSITS